MTTAIQDKDMHTLVRAQDLADRHDEHELGTALFALRQKLESQRKDIENIKEWMDSATAPTADGNVYKAFVFSERSVIHDCIKRLAE